MNNLIDGKKIAAEIIAELREAVVQIQSQNGRAPHLAAVLVGEDPASQAYVKNKVRSCEVAGSAKQHC